jgi:hypothetical protein
MNSRVLILITCIAGNGMLIACNAKVADAPKPAAVHVEKIAGSEFSNVELTGAAAQRLGIQTAPVEQGQLVRKRKVGGEVVGAPPGSGATGKAFVRVRLNESDINRVDKRQFAMIMSFDRSAPGPGLPAELDRTTVTKDTLFYMVDADKLNTPTGQRVFVEVALVGAEKLQKTIPYSAVLYGLHGESWAYTSTTENNFVRHPVSIDYIDGERAILSDGPPVGTMVVTVGSAELYGAESGVGGGH